MPDITKFPPIVSLLIAAVTSTAGLLATQSLITNGNEKLVTGLASVWIQLPYVGLAAIAGPVAMVIVRRGTLPATA